MKTMQEEFGEVVDRMSILERSVAELSIRNEELEKVVRKLQNHCHLLQRGLKILLSEGTPPGIERDVQLEPKKEEPPPPKAVIKDL